MAKSFFSCTCASICHAATALSLIAASSAGYHMMRMMVRVQLRELLGPEIGVLLVKAEEFCICDAMQRRPAELLQLAS